MSLFFMLKDLECSKLFAFFFYILPAVSLSLLARPHASRSIYSSKLAIIY